MDGRHLAFRDETFDVAYSLSSIEHFGGLQGAVSAIDEMARVVKPGGVVVVATEYRLSGPPYPDVFDGAQIQKLFDRPGLRLIEPIDEKCLSAISLYADRSGQSSVSNAASRREGRPDGVHVGDRIPGKAAGKRIRTGES